MIWARSLITLVGIAAGLAAQAPVGPVTPHSPESRKTVEQYAEQLKKLMFAGAPAEYWSTKANEDKLDFLQTLRDAIASVDRLAAMPVGPVTPRPKPAQPPPVPPTKPPTKRDLDTGLNKLQESLDKAKTKDPSLKLPATEDKDLQQLIQELTKARQI